MTVYKGTRRLLLHILVLVTAIIINVSSYDGSESWLHYTAVPTDVHSGYSTVCRSLVVSNPESDTLKNATSEMNLGMKGLLGKALSVGTTVAAGAIVLAPEGSPLVTDAGMDYTAINKEGFVIKSAGGATYISGKSEVGVLRGVFHFLRLMQMGKDISNLDIKESPYFPYRVLDHWWNHYGSNPEVERVYGGGRVYKMERFKNLSSEGSERTAVINYCRMAASLGLNGITPDGVNTVTMGSRNYMALEDQNIKSQKVFADIIGTWGLKYFLSVSYSSPQRVNPQKSSSNPQRPEVVQWWENKVKTITDNIANFGGFLIKADSENEFGPQSVFGAKQSAGAEFLGKILGKVGATLVWRTFIYSNSKRDDFAITQSETFADQTWNKNIILRMKDGPRDFQVVEPPNFLATYGGVRLGMEFQVSQEYTGHDKHICWMVPKWKQVLDWNLVGADIREGVKGTKMHQILSGDNTWENGGGVWAISNINNAKNWTGHYIHQANAYGYGRLAWNPLLTENQIADEWISCSFQQGNSAAVKYIVSDILTKSWKTYEDYTISYSALMPAVGDGPHYEIGFDRMKNSQFFTEFFMNMTNDGIGVDRTAKSSKFLNFLPKELADSLGNIATCPEDYLLFFHHCKWEYTMKSGMTLIQSLYHNHFRGLRQLKRFINNWKLLDGVIDDEIYSHVLGKLNTQHTDAARWVNTFKTDFGRRYSKAIGCDLEIVVPDKDKAVTVSSGGTVALSGRYADQKGTAVSETINWSVSDEGSLDATTGNNVNFSAASDGVYTVTASTATFSDLKDQLQIFVGDWAKALTDSKKTGVRKRFRSAEVKEQLTFSHTLHTVCISAPFAGNLHVLGLNGRLVTSLSIPKAGVFQWNTDNISKGLYLVQLNGATRNLRKKLLVR